MNNVNAGLHISKRERRKRAREIAENEKRIQILQKYGYNFYQAAENDNLYGHELC